jgi:hypothetical protein
MPPKIETMSHDTRIALLEERMDRLMDSRGETGIIVRMMHDIAEIKAIVFKARYVMVGCFGAIIVFQVLSGSGTVSLQNILKIVTK